MIPKLMFLDHSAAKMIPPLTSDVSGISVSNLGMKKGVFIAFLNTVNRNNYHGRGFILGLIS